MKSMKLVGFIFLTCLARLALSAEGNCEIGGVTEEEWDDVVNVNITDTDSGVVFERAVTRVQDVLSTKVVLYILNRPHYLFATAYDGRFTINLLDRFTEYEKFETSTKMAYQFLLLCNIGTRKLTVVFNIRDTNNHAPVFLPTNSYNYSLVLPVPQGFPISFVSDIIVNDNDLTNYEIVPQIQPNDYFNMSFVDVDSTRKKFKLVLTAKKTIRDFGTMVLLMGATDKDNTGYPQLTTFGQITITKGSDVEPEEQMEFTDLLYMGVFNNDYEFVGFDRDIALKTGYDDSVTFRLEEYGSEYFTTYHEGNNIEIRANSSNEIPEHMILGTESLVLILVAENSAGKRARAVLSFVLYKEPNCEFTEYNGIIWETGLVINMSDTSMDVSLRAYTKNILSVVNYTYEMGELNEPPYVIPVIYGDRIDFEIQNAAYQYYEQNEWKDRFTMYIEFKCKRNSRVLKVTHTIRDSNNHNPFLQSFVGQATYMIHTPLPMGYNITRTYGPLIIRDHDLTNYAINATLQFNPYISLSYRGPGPTKWDYVFDLITKVPIISADLPAKSTLTYHDVDNTGDVHNYNNNTVTLAAL